MRQRLLFPLSLLAVACSISWVPPAVADDAASDRSMRMYRDPETGAVGRPSAAALQAEAAGAPAAASAQPQPLTEEPVQAPAGGVKINLRGGHRPAVVRYTDPGAPPVHQCVDATGTAHE
ncbi:MAG TPA: hypothetical protein VL049_23595 [Candidatus Dormibacteraeota bacterium]|nr:hypothetical protein [Candidatus Dormibacteraeota bacterium]